MRLKDYLKKYNLKMAEVARRCDIPYSTFYYACEGYGMNYETMMKIIAECDGVKLEDLKPTKKGKTNLRSKKKQASETFPTPAKTTEESV